MPTSSNPAIQKLMDSVDALDPADENIEHKLQHIAEAIAAEQHRTRSAPTGQPAIDVPTDPADAFACDGCQ